jgi:hypothetical protein
MPKVKDIEIHRSPQGNLEPKGEPRLRKLKKGDAVTFRNLAGLADLVATFHERSPFSGNNPDTISFGTEHEVKKGHVASGNPKDNLYVYLCHQAGKAPESGWGGEIEIEPEG